MANSFPRDDSIDIVEALTESIYNLQSRLAILERLPSSGGLIEIETLEGNGVLTTLDFQNVPQIYKHLLLVGQARMVNAVTQTELSLRLNNDSGNNYHIQLLQGENASVASGAFANDSAAKIGVATGALADANHPAQIEAKIMNYVGTDLFKLITAKWHLTRGATLANFDMACYGNMWLDNSAINRVTVLNKPGSGGAFTSDTLFTLYAMI